MVGFYYLASYILFIAYQDPLNDHVQHLMEETAIENKQDNIAPTVAIFYLENQMQEYANATNKAEEYRDSTDGGDRSQDRTNSQHQCPAQKYYTCHNKDLNSQNIVNCKLNTGRIVSPSTSQQYQNTRYNNSSAPTFSSPPNSPLVGLIFDPSSSNYSGSNTMSDHFNSERRPQSSWSVSSQEPIGSGAKKKIVKSQDKRNVYSADSRYQERYKDMSTETDRPRKYERHLTSESTSSIDFYTEGERMVSELCNISDSNSKVDNIYNKSAKSNQEDDKIRHDESSDILLTALDRIVIHDQIPNQIVQLAIEACTDAENIAIAHHNRPCFKNIHSICAKTRSNVQKPDSAVANLHSQGIPWVIKNFIFSFVRILDGWKGVKELLSEKHDTFSRIENKYYSQNIRECFVQWQAVTKEMLTHIYKTFKCLDHGFTMEQKSFTHNYYATNSAAPRHQNPNKFQAIKQHISTPRLINASPQSYNVMQPPWVQAQAPPGLNYNENQWPNRSTVTYKKFPPVPAPSSHSFYPLNDQNESESIEKSQYRFDSCSIREAKPRQSWTISNVADLRALEGVCHNDQREVYTQLKHRMDAELGKAPGQPILNSTPCDLLHRREMEIKPKMIPLSHVEKNLIPNISGDVRTCFVQRNNSGGDTKEDIDFFAAWGQMTQKEPSDYLTHHTHNIQVPSNVVTISNNISGPVQFIDPENDEFHEMSKVYMKPGSYKVPIKPADPLSSFLQNSSQDTVYNATIDSTVNKLSLSQVTLAPQPKYNLESWPCLISRRAEEIYSENQKNNSQTLPTTCLDMCPLDSLDILNTVMSDQAWEAAKQSAPKLMDFIHEGSKSDAARLYDALGLNNNEEISNDLKQLIEDSNQNDLFYEELCQKCNSQQTSIWGQSSLQKSSPQDKNNDSIISTDNNISSTPNEEQVTDKNLEREEEEYISENKPEDSKATTRRHNFDQAGGYVKDENQRKCNKPKVAVSGMWYHPKKKKPLPNTIVKKFENIISTLSQFNESKFIHDDMDIKVAPRFYEVVKYPMCLNDISTKLKNSSYTEQDQVIQDFRRIFNNVRLYLKTYNDSSMKKNLAKVSSEFEKILNEEFPPKWDSKNKTHEHANVKESNSKRTEKENDTHKTEAKRDLRNELRSKKNDFNEK